MLALVSVCLCGACNGDPEHDGAHPSMLGQGASSSDTVAVSDVAALPIPFRWAYMLQNDVAAEIVGTDFSVVVMDYTKDGTDDVAQRYTAAEMNSIKSDGATRVALAYLSIGEAEEYRYYFDPRDEAHEKRMQEAVAPGGIWDCDKHANCIKVCPKDCRPMRAIMFLRRRAEEKRNSV